MDDLDHILRVSEDDIVLNVRYGLLYVLREGLLDLREAWLHRLITEGFSTYTHQNAVRLHRITVVHDDSIVFDLHLVDPDVALQEIVDDISDVLSGLLPWPHTLEGQQPWRAVQCFTIGAPASGEQEMANYIDAVRRSKAEDEGSSH